MSNPNIAFIGAGNMASSIIGGLKAKGFNAQSITASDPYPESLAKLQQGGQFSPNYDRSIAAARAGYRRFLTAMAQGVAFEQTDTTNFIGRTTCRCKF